MWRVTIIGAETAKEEIRMLQMRLIQQKRELLHVGSRSTIKDILVEKIEDEPEEL
jgi:hypothetical protein